VSEKFRSGDFYNFRLGKRYIFVKSSCIWHSHYSVVTIYLYIHAGIFLSSMYPVSRCYFLLCSLSVTLIARYFQLIKPADNTRAVALSLSLFSHSLSLSLFLSLTIPRFVYHATSLLVTRTTCLFDGEYFKLVRHSRATSVITP